MEQGRKTTLRPLSRVSLAKIRDELIATHGTRCAYCGVDIAYGGASSIDYYYPRSKFPNPPIENNYILSCRRCNMAKADFSPVSDTGDTILLHPYSERYRNEITFNSEGIAEGQSEAAKTTINVLDLNRPELVSYRKSNIGDYIDKLIDGNSAFDVYNCSIDQVKSLLQIGISDANLQEYFHRMLYANVISSMEAYLSKTIITIVLSDDTMFWRFVAGYEWGSEKVEIKDIKKTYDGMNIKVQTELAEVLYHNLSKVKGIYHDVLGINILTNKAEMAFLCRAVNIRHDIVHRNGRKKSNSKKDEFHSISSEMVTELISHVDLLVDDVEAQMNVNSASRATPARTFSHTLTGK